MTEERPKPRYGEYATPQSQAEAIAESQPPVSPLLAARPNPAANAGDSVDSGTTNPTAAGPVVGQNGTGVQQNARPHPPAETPIDNSWWSPQAKTKARAVDQTQPRRRWDLILTIGLLVYGALNVMSQIVQYQDITGFLNRMATTYPVFASGTFTPTGREAAVGVAISVVNLVLYLGTALLSVRRLRQRKLTFYVPLIGGAVAALLSAILLSTILASSPGFFGAVSAGI